MDKQEFEEFLHSKIPITKAMGITVIEFTKSRVKLSAQIEPNINDKLTAFGGSINALMTICGWAMTFINIKDVDNDVQIVIHKSNITYMAPINEDFIAECSVEHNESVEFIENYKKYNKARLNLKVFCGKKERIFVKYEGEYVAFK